jgi:predicted GIY-YIG superfamily endonuclease
MDDIVPSITSQDKTTFIYALIDPNTQLIRYIGKSNDPQKRLYRHLKEKGTSYKVQWLRSLKTNGQIPEIQIIEEVLVSQWQKQECYWIAYYRQLGYDLANGTDGGDGVHGRKRTPEERARIGAASTGNQYSKGRKPTPEETAKRSASLKGHGVSEETRKKIANRHTGRIVSKDTREKLSSAFKGKNLAEDRIAKMRGRKQSPETIAKRSSALKQTLAEKRRNAPPKEIKIKPPRVYKGNPGLKHTDEAKARISVASKGRKMSEEHRQKLMGINNGNTYAQGHKNSLGLKHTEEFKSARRAYRHTPEAREKIRQANLRRYGKQVNDEA